VLRDAAGEVVFDSSGQAKVRHEDHEIRLGQTNQAPFPLYPGERLWLVRDRAISVTNEIEWTCSFRVFCR
jgi:hypothetical protein